MITKYHKTDDDLPSLTIEEATYVEAAREAMALLKKTFEFWVAIARGLKALKDKADYLGGRFTFDRLREREGLGPDVINKTRVSRLLGILDRLPEVETWRATLSANQRFDWASPEAVYNHCPLFKAPRSEGRAEVAREERRREAPIDIGTLSMTSREKLEAAIRQEKRKLELEYSERVRLEVLDRTKERLKWMQEKEDLADHIIKARKGVMNRATYRKILSCLHPDRVQDAGLKRTFEDAFNLFTKLEKLVLNEDQSPTSSAPPLPSYAEMMARREQVRAEHSARAKRAAATRATRMQR